MGRTVPIVELLEVTDEIRGSCLALEVEPGQRGFVAPIADYLALCAQADSPWRPFAVVLGGEVVGFVMRGVDPDDDSAWIGGLVIGREHQGRGIGRGVVDVLVGRAIAEGRSSALSYQPSNARAKDLYASAGFVETGETEGDEVVARRPL